ncbi:crinkler family protein [Gigaspora margarita]|uniref:Crinkler family protein n=1 Tax=Gigaspora margarita TaxID=4874 RepID=A0A8H3XH69_GIGMA|nr:crinkler family protein [Gigaspora margarita]
MLFISTCINAIVFIGFSVAKRSYDDIDRTDVICDALIQPFSFVPSRAGDLTSLINAPLTRKLPVSKNEEIKYPLLADFIEKNDECRSDLSTYISGLIIGIGKQNLSNTSENMLHWVVDSIIRIPLQIFHENLGGVLPIDLDRNTRDQGTTTIGTKRPDFLCWANNVLLFKGEEKAVNADFPKAVNELEEKFNKFDPMYFGNIQFMICYAAAGTRLRFFAIDGSSNTNSPSRLIALSNQLDINTRRDRISILCIVVNIARIIRTVSNTIPAMIVPLGKRLKTERSMITILGDSVEKRVSVEYLPFAENLNDRINFLSKLYEHAKGHTGLAQVKESPRISRQAIYKVVL